MELHKFIIKKSKLNNIPEDELILFIMIGHIFNELNILNKLLVYFSDVPKSQKCLEQANNALFLFSDKILIGKLQEAWLVLKELFLEKNFRVSYESKLSQESKAALFEIEKYFSKYNLMVHVRGNFSFHYQCNAFKKTFKEIPESEQFDIYLSNEVGNSFYYSSEVVANHALLNRVQEKFKIKTQQEAMENIADESIKFSRLFIYLINGLMIQIIERYLLDENSKFSKSETIKLENLPSIHDIKLPYFTENVSG